MLEELRRINPQARMTVSSGHAVARARHGMRQASGFITKPCSFDDLLALIRQVLDSHFVTEAPCSIEASTQEPDHVPPRILPAHRNL